MSAHEMNHTPPRLPAPLFVTGTDTGVGKTVVSLLLMKALFRRGMNPFYGKPMQTGCRDPYDTDSDAAFVYRHVPELAERDPAEAVGWCFRAPKAPLHAARDERNGVETEDLMRRLAILRATHACLVLEGAGGLMVPFTADALCVDCIRAADARPVLVARDGLGTVNHTLLSVEAMTRRGVTPAGIVFVASGKRPTPPDLVHDNMEAVAMLSGISVSGIVPPILDFHAPPEAALAVADAIIDAALGL